MTIFNNRKDRVTVEVWAVTKYKYQVIFRSRRLNYNVKQTLSPVINQDKEV